MSEADRVPSPAAPPEVAAAAPDERKGKEPEREKLPPIVSAGAGAAAVSAGRGQRGAPTAGGGREGRGRPATPGAPSGDAARPSFPGLQWSVPRGQPRTLLELHLPQSGNVRVAASAAHSRLLSGLGGPLSLRK